MIPYTYIALAYYWHRNHFSYDAYLVVVHPIPCYQTVVIVNMLDIIRFV